MVNAQNLRKRPTKRTIISNGERSPMRAHHDLVVLRNGSGESAGFTVSLFFGSPDYATLKAIATSRLLPPVEVGGYTGRSFILKDGFQAQAPATRGIYGAWCRDPSACTAKGYCPLNPTCGD